MIYAVLYGPTSVQRIMDFIKTVYAFEDTIPVIVKPIGAAAQIGVPEAYKFAYRIGKSLLILPELTDLHEIVGVEKIYYIDKRGEKVSIKDLVMDDRLAIVLNGGEGEPSKKELSSTNIVSIEEIPYELPASPMISIILYLIKRSIGDTI